MTSSIALPVMHYQLQTPLAFASKRFKRNPSTVASSALWFAGAAALVLAGALLLDKI